MSFTLDKCARSYVVKRLESSKGLCGYESDLLDALRDSYCAECSGSGHAPYVGGDDDEAPCRDCDGTGFVCDLVLEGRLCAHDLGALLDMRLDRRRLPSAVVVIHCVLDVGRVVDRVAAVDHRGPRRRSVLSRGRRVVPRGLDRAREKTREDFRMEARSGVHLPNLRIGQLTNRGGERFSRYAPKQPLPHATGKCCDPRHAGLSLSVFARRDERPPGLGRARSPRLELGTSQVGRSRRLASQQLANFRPTQSHPGLCQ